MKEHSGPPFLLLTVRTAPLPCKDTAEQDQYHGGKAKEQGVGYQFS